MDQSWILLDPSTGLHVAWYFWLRVLDETNRATRYGMPFALLLLEADPGALDGARARSKGAETVGLIPPTIRSTDLGGFISPGRAAVLLTHQDAESAEQARDRFLQRLSTSSPEVRWIAQLLSFPADAADISHLLTTGWEAPLLPARRVKLPA
jgi:GGDEF domain-containing protein